LIDASEMDYITALGPLALTLRLKRLAEHLSEDGRRLYESLQVPLEPSWYALIMLLRDRGPLPVTGAAAQLGLSHPSVVDTSHKLEKAGLLQAAADPGDGRRRILSLSDRAQEQLPEFERLWEAFRQVLSEMLARTGGDMLASLDALDAGLDEVGLDERVRFHLEAGSVSRPTRGKARESDIAIRPAEEGDRAAILHMARELVRAGDTYAYDPGIADDALWRYWAPEGPGQGYVAVQGGEVVGMFVIKPNHPGPGSHVANASYAVRADVRGLGLGRTMGEASIRLAAELGYRAMQFNIVVSTNERAVRLWRSLGFRVIGTIPFGFRLPDGRCVDHYIMYRSLE